MKFGIWLIAVALAGCAAERFENPVIDADWPDPAFWQVDGHLYSVATGLETIRTSEDGINWRDTGIAPLSPAAREKLVGISRCIWAPCVKKIGGKWILYISSFIDDVDCRVSAFVSTSPTGPFEYASEVVNGPGLGIVNAIDPYILENEGTIWMFFGSCQGGIHRVRLTDDGLAIRPGEKPVHVAGLGSVWKDGKRVNSWGWPGTWEGSYLHHHDGWWYLFFSGGKYNDNSYHLMVGRSRTLDGVFLNREGEKLTDAKAKPILYSDKGDRFFGPGHNGEVIKSVDGREYMYFHSHDANRENRDERPTFLQELKWDKDGWPYFEGGKPLQYERKFIISESVLSGS